MKKSHLFFCLSVIFLLSCQDNKWENEITKKNLLIYNGPNKVGKYLVKKLEKQSNIKTESEMTINHQEKVLFDYTEIGVGSMYGLHYIIPVINETTGYINKAII
ncbi:hypothetical protein [Gabonibacter chumensis]|uniref:hypothetical protein n=1 Tax=Gabonibacter chumensis TaxID=2972474 RepID=UPI0025740E9B|nr:hypothetical protein [Gabonibacter chumensis]MCR9010778.1 hypothetical protein [Gabonibacter chumensis]